MSPVFKKTIVRRALSASRVVFGPVALVFLAVAGWTARHEFSAVVAQARPGGLLVAVLLWAALHLWSPFFAWIVLRGCGSSVAYSKAIEIHINRLPARYLPGGIWHTFTRVLDFRRHGIEHSQLAAFVLLENVWSLGAALMLGGVCLFLAVGLPEMRFPAVAAIMTGLSLVVLAPVIVNGRFRCPRLLSLRTCLAAVGVMLIFWAVAASAFVCYWGAFSAADNSVSLPNLYAAYLFAWSAGFVSIFAPQGIGVFEAVAGWLLTGFAPIAGVVALVAGFRVTVLMADALVFGLKLLVSALIKSIRQN